MRELEQAFAKWHLAAAQSLSHEAVWFYAAVMVEAGNIKSRVRQLLIDLTIVAGTGLLLALLGPFGSFEQPFAWRLVYRISLSVAGYFCFVPITAAFLRAGEALELPSAASWVAANLVATVPVTVLVIFAGQVPGPFAMPSLEAGVRTYGYVLVIGAFVSILFELIESRAGQAFTQRSHAGTTASSPPAEPVGHTRASLLERLPPELGNEIVALEMEDNYVRVHTALGSHLVLMRMRDAVAELEEAPGMQVHRSWWVARHAVTDVRREGRKVTLTLDNGLDAPVSRAMVTPLKEAGWI